MKPLKAVAEAYVALGEADRLFREDAFEDALDSARKAMEASRRMPDEEAFDHEGFDAFCHALMAGAYGRLGRFDDALASADLALLHFNRRGELNEDGGRLWIIAVYGRGLALEGLGRGHEALSELGKCAEMIGERKAEMLGREVMLGDCLERAGRLESSSKQVKKSGYRAWWEFWS